MNFPNRLKSLTRVATVMMISFAFARADAAAMPYQINEIIEVSTTGAWDRAIITEVGATGGEHEGQYKVHFIGYAASYDRWLLPTYFRKVSPNVAPAGQANVPYQLNARIEVNTTGAWDRATIVGVGAPGSEHEGEYKVHFDGFAASYDRWLLPAYFRKLANGEPTPLAAVPTAATITGSSSEPPIASNRDLVTLPRLGHYHIMSYGTVGKPPLSLGQIELLAEGIYRIAHKRNAEPYGEGNFAFDAATSTVEWLSGPCKDNAWGGRFTIENAGKTHKIRLRTTTTATNTHD